MDIELPVALPDGMDAKAYCEAVLNWTLPGTKLLFRDTDLPLPEKGYEKGRILRAGFFIDCSSKGGCPTKKTRVLIASAHAAPLCNVPLDEDFRRWGLHVLHFNSYLKVMDVYHVGDKTQVFLLHIPYGGVPLFAGETSMDFGEASLIKIVRENFDKKLQTGPVAELDTEDWTKRTHDLPGFHLGTADPFPLEYDSRKISDTVDSLGGLVHKLACDMDAINFPSENFTIDFSRLQPIDAPGNPKAADVRADAVKGAAGISDKENKGFFGRLRSRFKSGRRHGTAPAPVKATHPAERSIKAMVEALRSRAVEIPASGDFDMAYAEVENEDKSICLTHILLRIIPVPSHLDSDGNLRYLEVVGYRMPKPYKSAQIIKRGTKEEIIEYLDDVDAVVKRVQEIAPQLGYNLNDI